MAKERMDTDKLIRMFMEHGKEGDHHMLSNLPHNPIDLEGKVGEMKKEMKTSGRFELRDFAGAYKIMTYPVGVRNYVTVLMEEKARISCSSPVLFDTLDSLHTRSMRDAIQLHYDAVGHYGK